MNLVLPIIKQIVPRLLAEEICGVQPMTEPIDGLFKLRSIRSSIDKVKDGELCHSFTDGWLVGYGTEWISVDLWWKIKIAGL